MSPLRVAVIGLGIGRRHVRAFQSLEDVQVTVLVGTNAEALQKAGQEFGIGTILTDYRQMLARDDVDLISICTPDRLHTEQALLALEAGKHVLCEKPLATTTEDARRLVHKVRETGCKFMVVHNYRFIPQFVKVKELVEAGALGPAAPRPRFAPEGQVPRGAQCLWP